MKIPRMIYEGKRLIVLKSSFLRTLPYIGRDKSHQQFISKLINKIFLTKKDQDELSEYFNVRNKHWSRWSGESNFRIWMLFTSPESCSVFDKKLIDKARIKIIPYITVFEEGELDKNSVVRKFRTTASDGKNYETTFYNLDLIISLGYPFYLFIKHIMF